MNFIDPDGRDIRHLLRSVYEQTNWGEITEWSVNSAGGLGLLSRRDIMSLGGDGFGNGFANISGGRSGTVFFGTGSYTEIHWGEKYNMFASTSNIMLSPPGPDYNNIVGWINMKEPDKVDLQSKNVMKQFRLWQWYLKKIKFKTPFGKPYHLSDIVDYSSKKKLSWWKRNFGSILNTSYDISGTIKYVGERVGFEISIMDGNFDSADNYRNNYVNAYSVGDTERQKFQNLYRVYWHSRNGHSVIFTFTSEIYYNFFLGD